MSGNISFNPYVTTNALGSFNIQTTGFIQGTALDQPAIRFALSGGVLASTETLPMWGGIGISENIPGLSGGPLDELGGVISRATSETAGTAGQLTGFSVFDQAHSMVNFPQSPVPQSAVGGLVNFYRLGSGARIAVAMDPALVSLEGEVITTQVSWDFTNQRLIAYNGSALPVRVIDVNIGNSMTVTYNSGTGFVTWNRSGSCAIILI